MQVTISHMHFLIYIFDVFPSDESAPISTSCIDQKQTSPKLHATDVLRAWQVQNFITTKAMQEFLQISPAIGLTGLPADWRTVIRRYNVKANNLKVAEVAEVCSKCFIYRFPSVEYAQ